MYKHEKLYQELKHLLSSQEWTVGERFHSEQQLCMKYALSRQTVRKALQRLVEEGYLFQERGSGTYITDRIHTINKNYTLTIGVLVTYLNDYIFPYIIKEIEEVFTQVGYSVQLASTGNSSKQEGKLLQKMLDNEVDGIILEPTRSALPNPNVGLYKNLVSKKYPLVSIHSSYPEVDIPTVALDDKEAGRLACSYLFSLQHMKIGAILKSDDLQGHNRYKGILAAHEEVGLEFDDKNVYWYTTEDLKNITKQRNAILERIENCSAVICYNDQIGIELEQILLDAHVQVPGEKSIISIDNSKFASYAPVPLTSVESPIATIGRAAAQQLLKQIRRERFDEHRIFQPKLITRDSCSLYKNEKRNTNE